MSMGPSLRASAAPKCRESADRVADHPTPRACVPESRTASPSLRSTDTTPADRLAAPQRLCRRDVESHGEKQVDRPAAGDPPGSIEMGKKLADLSWRHQLPCPEEREVAGVAT